MVGARADDDQGSSSGSVYIYSRSGGSWTLDTKLVDPDGESSDSFGASVALEGDRLAVGTPGDTDMGYFSGSVTLFNRSTGDWLLEDKLVVANGALYDGFGGKISLSGETLAVTADLEEEEAEQSGAVYVYTLQAGSWGLQQKLKAPGEPADGRFGRDIHLEGDTLAVASSAGEPLRIYERVGVEWNLARHWTPFVDQAAIPIAFSGSELLAGFQGADTLQPETGAALIFSLTTPPQCNGDGSCACEEGFEGPLCEQASCVIQGVGFCEDGNSCTADSCDETLGCVHEILPDCCGNQLVEGAEDCDDGNTVNGDGCSSACENETPRRLCSDSENGPHQRKRGVFHRPGRSGGAPPFDVWCDMEKGGWAMLLSATSGGTYWGNGSPNWDKAGTDGATGYLNEETHQTAYGSLPTQAIRLCYQDSDHCYDFKHNPGISLQEFFTGGITYTAFSTNTVGVSDTGIPATLDAYGAAMGVAIGSGDASGNDGIYCDWLGINLPASTSAIGWLHDENAGCVTESELPSSWTTERLDWA